MLPVHGLPVEVGFSAQDFARGLVDVAPDVGHDVRLSELDGECHDELVAVIVDVGDIEGHVLDVNEAVLELVRLVHDKALDQVGHRGSVRTVRTLTEADLGVGASEGLDLFLLAQVLFFLLLSLWTLHVHGFKVARCLLRPIG